MKRKVTTSSDPKIEKFWAELVNDWAKIVKVMNETESKS